MSGAQETRAKRRQTRGDAFLKRPETEDPNSHILRYGWMVQHAMIGTDAIIYRALEWLKPKFLPNGKGRLIPHCGVTKVANATARFTHDGKPIPRRTVAHRLRAMHLKGIVIAWDQDECARLPTSPVGTSYLLVPFDHVLERWKNDPLIFTPRNRAFYVRGKGKTFVTPETALAWGATSYAGEPPQAFHAGAVDYQEPAAEPTQNVEPVARPPRRMTVQEAQIEDVAIVHRAILDQGVKAEPEHAAALLAIARQVASSISAAQVGMLIVALAFGYAMQERRRLKTSGDVAITWTVGWFTNDMAAAAHAWLRQRDEAQRATGTAL